MGAFIPLPIEDPALVVVTPQTLNTEIDEVSDTITYIGKSAPGSPSSSNVWSIQRLTYTGNNLSIKRADSGNFSQIWDDRLSLTYS